MKEHRHWNRLDNAAKIFPPSANRYDTKVFRFACELYEDIDKDVLQEALDKAIIQFPIFCVVMKKGLFWYYLEESAIKPVVKEENKRPCAAIYDKNVKKLLFEVTYFKKRINLEIYHALTDGTGALEFLKLIILNYIVLKNSDEFKDKTVQTDYDASGYQKDTDSFKKYYDKNAGKKTKLVKAYKIKGEKVDYNSIKIIEGIMSVKDVIAKAHEYNATLTSFIAGIFIKAIYDEMKLEDKNKSINLSVPVNLRKYFESVSARNFFAVLNVKYKKMSELDDIIKHTDKYLKEQLTVDELKKKMNAFISVEKNIGIRFVPLIIKNIVLKIANKIASSGETTSLSNVGSIKMPEEVKKYINLFDIMVSTDRLQACMCSYEDKLVLNFSSVFENTDIQKRVFRTLSDFGIDVTIQTNI